MFARKVSMHLKGSVPDFTQTLEREVIPCFENRRDSWTKSRLCTRRKGSIVASVCGTGRKRGSYNPELTPKWRSPGEGDDELLR